MKRKIVLVLVALASAAVFAQRKSALELFNSALERQERREWFEAVDLYREALEINPQYGDAWFNLAKCSYILGSYDLAVEYADNAAKYAKNFSGIQNLKGLALISLGKIAEAKAVFNDVLSRFPNDIDARFGLAELDLLDGKISVAESRYLDALKRDGSNRKALLSLALISAEMGKNSVAENYIQQAMSFYSGEAEVHYMAAYLAAKRGDFRVAEQRCRSAVQIDGNFDSAYSLLAGILYSQKRYDEVIDICDFRIGRKRDLSGAWYMKGLSQSKLGRVNKAIETLEAGLMINPQDEVMRNALEQLIAESIPIEDSRRNYWAQYHFDKALEYGRNFRSLQERYEYQKALGVAPLNAKMRQNFADMLSRDGYYELYVEQLKFLRDNDAVLSRDGARRDENSPQRKKSREQTRNDDALESYESLMRNNIAARWGVEPFYMDKTRWNIGIFYTRKPVQLFHADLEEVSAIAAKNMFNGVPSASVHILTRPVEGYGEAFRQARTSGRDYFILMSASETERTFSIDATIYSARTGTKTAEVHVYRTGNDCMANSLQRFRQGVLDILPIRGKVVRNVQGKLLLDLGRNDGVSLGSEFDIVRKGQVITKDAGPGVTYTEKDLLGTVRLTEVNEEISEGEYKKKGFYDTLNAGDEIVLTKMGGDTGSKDGSAPTDSRPAADSEGSPATKAAQTAERDAMKESLRPSSRESDLIHLIRGIF